MEECFRGKFTIVAKEEFRPDRGWVQLPYDGPFAMHIASWPLYLVEHI